MGGDDITALLSYFQFPVLQYLRVAAQVFSLPKAHDRYQDSAEDIMHFVDASGCPLSRLELHNVALTDFELRNCFSTMPDLDMLHLVDSGGMADVLECLRTGVRDPRYGGKPVLPLPKLTVLLVETVVPENWPRQLFNAMCNLRSTVDIIGCEGSKMVQANLMHGTRPFTVHSELSRFVRSLGQSEGINLQLPYVKEMRTARPRK